MNIEFIKWMCDKAEGFELSDSFNDPSLGLKIKYLYGDNSGVHERPEKFLEDNHPIRKILLQGAIEGVNREDSLNYIEQTHYGVDLRMASDEVGSWECSEVSVDQAKEAALLYIYEQIDNKK